MPDEPSQGENPNPTPKTQPGTAAVPNHVFGIPGLTGVVGSPVFPLSPNLPQGVMAQIEMQQVQVWQGQFPPPDAVERYEALEKGTFGRLLSMAERAQEAQIEATRLARDYQRNDVRRGHYLGFLVAALAMVAAMICVYLKQPWVAAACMGVPVLSVARALVGIGGANNPVATQQLVLPTTTPAAATPSKTDSKDGEAPTN